MPDAYVGKNIYIRDTIEGFIEGSNNWYTTVALPIQVTDQQAQALFSLARAAGV